MNGIVDETDISALAANWGASEATWMQGDFNADGLVNIIDLGIMATYWQGAGEGPAFVPEPATIMLLIAGWAVMLKKRKRTNK